MKKGAMSWQVILMMVAAVGGVVLIVVYAGGFRTGGRTITQLSAAHVSLPACERLGEQKAERSITQTWDLDGDGLPNSCEVCVGGNDYEQTDDDRLPDPCDADPLSAPGKGKPYKNIKESCLKAEGGGRWNPKTLQCCLTTGNKRTAAAVKNQAIIDQYCSSDRGFVTK